ncbi:protein BREAST CANCER SUSCEPTIBILITY 1 homolog, partial [Carica papaya]|uniref:protein BREAST CANCER SUSCEPTIBILITY 1 homolog n=1 Tax=Carica papaya TaxID=3649 RepID=UPI000B8CE317
SAVSLTCNHVFCNACIMKSMKLGSNCPVCKVPYHRRELRAAPHMDSLVSIYKSMEAASGVNIFLTQTAATNKPNEENSVKGDLDRPGKIIGGTCQDTESESALMRINFRIYTANIFFSDLKDSEDESPLKVKVHGKSNTMDLFDSEMFEWTQRACSPELISSPVKIKVPDTNEVLEDSKSEGAMNEGPLMEGLESINLTQELGASDRGVNILSIQAKITSSQMKSGNFSSRSIKARKNIKRKSAKKSKGQASSSLVDPKKKPENFISKGAEGSVNPVNLEITGNEKAGNNIYESDSPRKAPFASHRAELLDKGEIDMVNQLNTTMFKEPDAVEDTNMKNSGESSKNDMLHGDACSQRSKERKVHSVKTNITGEDSEFRKQTNKRSLPQKTFSSDPSTDGKNIYDLKEKHSKQAREFDSTFTSKCNKELRSKKKMKVSFDDVSRVGLVNECHGHKNILLKEIQLLEKVSCSSAPQVLNGSSIVKNLPLTNEVALRKCAILANKIQCAFCLSSEDSEVSGEMFHYYNGRPVSADYEGGSKIIHSHKNCTEWAPNVYFENDTAINLEAELSRSRRIKCCCCGLKGAALGCYERSCRKIAARDQYLSQNGIENRGKLRLLNKGPKPFDGLKFFFMGDFVPSYKGYLQDLVAAAGGTVLHRKPISGDQEPLLSESYRYSTLIVYSLELPDKHDPGKQNLILSRRESDAYALASSIQAKAVSNSWVLNSIAACKMQNLPA